MALLRVEGLTIRFGGLTAVNAVDLEVEEGKITAVIGPNGAGKTTLFNAITGIYPPTEGRALFAGRDVARPLTLGTALRFLGVGLFVSLLCVLAVANVDRLWTASVAGQYVDDNYSWGRAWDGFVRQLFGEPRVAPNRARTVWSVIDSEGKSLLGGFRSEGAAEEARVRLESGENAPTGPDPDNPNEPTERVREQVAARSQTLKAAALGGLLLGAFGAFAVWRRSRRSTDLLARSGLARTFQNIRLFGHMTVLENVLVARDRFYRRPWLGTLSGGLLGKEGRAAQAAKARELLTFIGLTGREDTLARNLPYGDQRRLEIARAMATEPRLVLLDEPAAGMNPSETVELMGLIRRIRERGMTVLLIEHHMDLVMGCSDKVAVLDYGKKIADGRPQEVRNDPRVVEAYLGKEEVG